MNPSRAVTFFANVAPSLMPFTVFQSALTMEGLGFCSAKVSFRASMEPDAVSRFEAELQQGVLQGGEDAVELLSANAVRLVDRG